MRTVFHVDMNSFFASCEIAESNGLTRQGVRHIIKKVEDELLFLETKLGLANRFVTLESAYNSIANNLMTVSEMVENGAPKNDITELLGAEIEKIRTLELIGEK